MDASLRRWRRSATHSASRFAGFINRLLLFGLTLAAVASATLVECLQAQTTGINLGIPTTAIPGIDPGELLLTELNCAACHSADAGIKARTRTSPRLGETGMRITPQYLRAFLTNPQGEKPGTPMPDLLHGLNASEKSESVEALVHFLVSQSQKNSPALPGADAFKMQQGRLLYHQVGCVACHAPQETVAALQTKPVPGEENAPAKANSNDLTNLKNSSVTLGNLAKKTTVVELAKFLIDPLKVRPGGRMPSLNLTENEANAIAMYLLRDQIADTNNPARPPQKIQGLSYQYYEGTFHGVPAFDKLQVTDSGFVDNFTIAPRKRRDQVGLRFTGFVNVPANGNYTFYTESDDGSRLYIGEQLVVNNDGDHAATERKGSIQLKAGEHAIMVGWFNSGGDAVLKVSYEGPGISKQLIPNSALSRLGQPMIPLDAEQFVLDGAKVNRGGQLFGSLGCASCHQVETIASSLKAKPLASLSPKQADGCLGDQIKKGVPQFHLSDLQRTSLQNTLAHPQKLSEALEPKEQVSHTLAVLNCYACHARNGSGGPDLGRADYFTTIGNVDMGDEGRFPPNLTKVGNKLRPEWIQDVLVKKGAVRPYMATRMPQFGEPNVGHLAAAFEKADASAPTKALPEFSATEAKFGRKLVGTGGLSCIACHTFGAYKSLGIPAIDLTQMSGRLKKDWFRRYLLEPQSLRPGTRMPNFWPEGKSVNNDILGGNTEKQINAIWSYLSKGRAADIPEGLIRGRMEIVADKEPVIYRNFIAGAGSRAIGVGYPEKVNLAFDANELRLALIWQGAFIDGARHRTGRGEGFEPPLGNNVIKMPPGPAFAMLTDANAPWPQAIGKKAAYQMRGYRLDEKGRPTFLYSFETTRIEDSLVAAPGELDAGLLRTLTFQCERPRNDLWFRAGVGARIEATPDGWYLIDDKLKVKFTLAAGARPVVRQNGGQSELLVPVVFNGQEARIVEEINW